MDLDERILFMMIWLLSEGAVHLRVPEIAVLSFLVHSRKLISSCHKSPKIPESVGVRTHTQCGSLTREVGEHGHAMHTENSCERHPTKEKNAAKGMCIWA